MVVKKTIYAIKPLQGPIIRVVADSISVAIRMAGGYGIADEEDVLSVENKGTILVEEN